MNISERKTLLLFFNLNPPIYDSYYLSSLFPISFWWFLKNGSFNVDAEIRQREARQRQKKQEQEEEERRQREEHEKQQEQNFHLHTAETADLHKVSTSEILSTDNIDLNTSPSRGDSTYEIYQPANSPSLSKQSSSYNNQSFRSSDNGSQGVDLADEISILDDMLGLYDDEDDWSRMYR